MINEATVRLVKYPPELIPDSWFGNVPLNAEVAPPVMDLKRFAPYIAILTNIQLGANAAVVLRARYNDVRIEENTAALLNLLPGAWRLPAKDILYYNFFGTVGAPVANYPTHFGLWVKGGSPTTPTVADKLLYGIKLTPDETSLAEKYNIRESVEKGVLPIPISQQIEREYHVLGEETHSRSINIAVAATTYTIETLYPKPNEILVLTQIAAAPGAAAQNIQIIIDRDSDANYATFPTFPLSLAFGGEVECFIPAPREIRLTTTATVVPGVHLFRYTVRRIKITNTLRARFGLASKDELPGEVWEKCAGGIL